MGEKEHPTRDVNRFVLGLLLFGALAVSTGYGMLLLLPLYVTRIGGQESDFGVISAAGTVTAAIAIGLLIRFPAAVPPQWTFAATSTLYGGAALAVSFVHSLGVGLIFCGVALGTAWAVAYTTGPMIVSELVGDERRGVYIGYVTGMIQIGFGLGPILGNAILRLGLSFESVFRCAAALSVLAALAVVALGKLAPELSRVRQFSTAHQTSLSRDLSGIIRSPAMIPLVMVLLCACVFTTMNSFQTTFADRNRLNFDVFYASYTVAVIFARFVLVRVLPDPTSRRTLRGATTGIVVSVLAFLAVGGNEVIYGVASVLLGITYGLALPLIQANAVNLSTPQLRPRMLPLAGLLFQTAILAFPFAAGWIIAAAGYQAVFLVLVGFALAVATLSFMQPAAAQPAQTPPTVAEHRP